MVILGGGGVLMSEVPLYLDEHQNPDRGLALGASIRGGARRLSGGWVQGSGVRVVGVPGLGLKILGSPRRSMISR